VPLNSDNFVKTLAEAAAQSLTPRSVFLWQNEHSLVDLLDADAVFEIFANDSELLNQLLPHLPPGQRNPEALRDNLRFVSSCELVLIFAHKHEAGVVSIELYWDRP
jgi:hypothetical protein